MRHGFLRRVMDSSALSHERMTEAGSDGKIGCLSGEEKADLFGRNLQIPALSLAHEVSLQ